MLRLRSRIFYDELGMPGRLVVAANLKPVLHHPFKNICGEILNLATTFMTVSGSASGNNWKARLKMNLLRVAKRNTCRFIGWNSDVDREYTCKRTMYGIRLSIKNLSLLFRPHRCCKATVRFLWPFCNPSID